MTQYRFYSRTARDPKPVDLRDDLTARRVAMITTDVMRVERGETVVWRRVENDLVPATREPE